MLEQRKQKSPNYNPNPMVAE